MSMDRKIERVLLRIGAFWNIINGMITLFFYSPWIKNDVFTNMSGETTGLNYLSENLNVFVTTYGLLFITIGVFNLYLSTRLFDGEVCVKTPVWVFLLGLISYISMDIISAGLYIACGVMSLAKNKALKLKYE